MGIEPPVLLSVSDLRVDFTGRSGTVTHAVRGANFEVRQGEIVGLVGESGSGKSVTALSIVGLLSEIHATLVSGSIEFAGQELVGLPEAEMRALRGDKLSIIFQDPLSSLDPTYRVGWQVGETIRIHRPHMKRGDVEARVVSLLSEVGIPDAQRRQRMYPYEFSGGMRQRVMIATALANHPRLLIADEPTTALDVTVQAQVLRLLPDIRSNEGLAVLLITHDLGVIAEVSDKVLVMYGGEIVEQASVHSLFDEPKHPYTVALMRSRPSVKGVLGPVTVIPGQPPDPAATTAGCRFQPRCWLSGGRELCIQSVPEPRQIASDHKVSCHFADEIDPIRP